MKLFQFRTNWYTDGRSEPIAIRGSREWILSYVSEAELVAQFGGYAEWRAPKVSSIEMPGEAIGVWGSRKVSRLKRLLHERGAEFEVVLGSGPSQALKSQFIAHTRV